MIYDNQAKSDYWRDRNYNVKIWQIASILWINTTTKHAIVQKVTIRVIVMCVLFFSSSSQSIAHKVFKLVLNIQSADVYTAWVSYNRYRLVVNNMNLWWRLIGFLFLWSIEFVYFLYFSLFAFMSLTIYYLYISMQMYRNVTIYR